MNGYMKTEQELILESLKLLGQRWRASRSFQIESTLPIEIV